MSPPASDEALLRAPAFPGAKVSVARRWPADDAIPSDPLAIFARVRAARIGGRFWDALADLPRPAGTILRPRRIEDLPAHLKVLDPSERRSALWVAPRSSRRRAGRWARALKALVAESGSDAAWCSDIDPWSVLEGADCLMAHGDDEWVALARIAGVPVRVLSAGRFGAPGDDGTALDFIAARALASADYRDPFTDEPTTLEATIDLLAMWRTMLDTNRTISVACGMAWWKRTEIRTFLWSSRHPLRLVSAPRQALALARRAGGAVAIWPSRVSPTLIETARQQGVPLVRVEDGFVRSVGLGVDLVPPSSIVVDRSGIHFDPSGPSDLEKILSSTTFAPDLVARAHALRETIVVAGISKYGAGAADAVPERQPGRKLVLVPGQVGDDMSVLAGGGGLSNLDLLRRAREMEPEAEIWFRPHPDVDAGHRKGAIPDDEVLALADRIARGSSMAALLDTVDAVHVLTSLTGFEALLRGRDVTCHGTPFYAGWGLTRDLGPVPDRRGRPLSLDELVAGVLILYPRYLDPVTGLACPPEVLVRRMAQEQTPNRLSWVAPLRRWQGRLMAALR